MDKIVNFYAPYHLAEQNTITSIPLRRAHTAFPPPQHMAPPGDIEPTHTTNLQSIYFGPVMPLFLASTTFSVVFGDPYLTLATPEDSNFPSFTLSNC